MKAKIFLPILIVLIVIGCRRKSSDNYEYYKPYEKDTILVDDIDSLEVIDSSEEVISETETIELKEVDLNDNYFIVIASYGVEEFAQARKAQLIEQGYKPGIFMENDDGWFKLAIKSFQTREEATIELEKLQVNNNFPSARIVFKRSK